MYIFEKNRRHQCAGCVLVSPLYTNTQTVYSYSYRMNGRIGSNSCLVLVGLVCVCARGMRFRFFYLRNQAEVQIGNDYRYDDKSTSTKHASSGQPNPNVSS